MTKAQLSALIRDVANTASEHSVDIIENSMSKMNKESFSFIDLCPLLTNAMKVFTVEVLIEVLSRTLPEIDEQL